MQNYVVVERNSRLLRFKQQLEAALKKQKSISEMLKRKEAETSLKSVKSHGYLFYEVYPSFRQGKG